MTALEGPRFDAAHDPAPADARGQLAWSVLESLPGVAFLVYDHDLRVVTAGGEALRERGYSPALVAGRLLRDVLPATVYACQRPHYRAALSGETRRSTDPHPGDGTVVESQFTPVRAADGTILHGMVVSRPVDTPRPPAPAPSAAEAAEVVQLARVVAATGEAIVATGPDGRIETVNPKACELFGYAEDELVGMRASRLVAPERRDVCDEARRAVSLSGQPWRGEHDHLTRDGRRFPAAVTMSPIYDADGEMVGRSVLVTDVSERREAQERLLEANRRFEQTIHHAPIGMALVGTDGSWLEVNKALCDLVGYSREELLGLTFQDITHPDDLDLDLALVGEVLEGARESYEMEKRYVRSDGSIVWILLTVSLLRDAAGEPVHFISQILDISDRKSNEAHLREVASADELTGLLNRRAFTERLSVSLANDRRDGRTSSLLFCDLDGFKPVNDRHGHAVGDAVLRAVAEVLRAHTRRSDALARHGGDEFVVLLEGTGEPDARRLAAEVAAAIEAVRVEAGSQAIGVGVSIGLAVLEPGGPATAEAAIAEADRAMYAVKSGRRAA